MLDGLNAFAQPQTKLCLGYDKLAAIKLVVGALAPRSPKDWLIC